MLMIILIDREREMIIIILIERERNDDNNVAEKERGWMSNE